jgi:HlyD family secretion protein
MNVLRSLLGTWAGRAIAGVGVVAIVGSVVIAPRLGSGTPAAQIRTAAVARGSITQSVAISGAVDASAQVRLSFGAAGRLTELLVGVGQRVVAGQPLARLDTTDLATSVRQAEASLASAQARYDSTIAGISAADLALAKGSLDDARRSNEEAKRTTASDLAAAELALSKAKTSYLSAKTNFSALTIAAVADAQIYQSAIGRIRADVVALRDKLDAMDRAVLNGAVDSLDSAAQDLATAETHATWTLQNAAAEYGAMTTAVLGGVTAFDRAIADGTDTSPANAILQATENSFETAASRLTSALDAPGSEIGQAESAVASAYAVLTSTDADLDTDTSLNAARSDIVRIQIAIEAEQQLASTIRGRVTQANGSLSTLSDSISGGYVNALQAHATAQDRAASTLADRASALRSAELSYGKTTAAPKDTDVTSAYASLLQAEASLEKAQNDLASATLTAPTSGVVASISGQIGETVSGGAAGFIVLANTSALVLHGTVGEAEVATLEVGQVATVGVDAVGSETSMTGKVTAIDPVATIQQGVPVYGVDVRIDIPATAVRAGMTGTATVIVANKPDVLTIPNLAIRSSSGRRFVEVLREGKIEQATVAFGISNETVTEVTDGLQEGDQVVLPQPRTTTAQQPLQQRPVPAGGAVFR